VAVSASYPNPFHQSTTITFEIARSDHVTLAVFDPYGRHIATLADGPYQAGSYRVRWDAAGLASGVYLYRLQTGAYSAAGKVVLVR
jgi:hypothetical protein